ncbi:branched-chain amino acid ABC transporter permease [Bradyrhizobium manausense]
MSIQGLFGVPAIAAAAIVFPFAAPDFIVFQATIIVIYTIAIMGLSILTGINGQISLGHGAFFAVGTYMFHVLTQSVGLPYFLAIPVAGLICFVFGYLFGLPALRLDGVYLALASFALSVSVPPILKLSFLEHWTGGVQGMMVFPPEVPFGLPIGRDQWLYLFVLFTAVLMYLGAANLISSRSGRAMAAIRDNVTAARPMGIDVAHYKTLAFGLSAFYAGIGGTLSAIVVQYIAPDSFSFFLSVYFVVGLVVGGVGWLPGAFVGGAFMVLVPNLAEKLSPALAGGTYGLLLIVLMLVMPKGWHGLYQAVVGRLRRRYPNTSIKSAPQGNL